MITRPNARSMPIGLIGPHSFVLSGRVPTLSSRRPAIASPLPKKRSRSGTSSSMRTPHPESDRACAGAGGQPISHDSDDLQELQRRRTTGDAGAKCRSRSGGQA